MDEIVLVDEVDILFTEEFYGNTYCPTTKIKNKRIKPLTDLIWNYRNKSITLYQIK